MSKDKPSLTAKQLKEVADGVESAAKEYLERLKEDGGIKEFVSRILDARLEMVIKSLMGFDSRWSSGWEVDHCNGRIDHSVAGQWIKAKATEAVQSWLEENMKPELIKLDKGMAASIKKSYRERLEYCIREQVETMAKRHAEAIGEDAVNKLLAEADLADEDKERALYEKLKKKYESES